MERSEIEEIVREVLRRTMDRQGSTLQSIAEAGRSANARTALPVSTGTEEGFGTTRMAGGQRTDGRQAGGKRADWQLTDGCRTDIKAKAGPEVPHTTMPLALAVKLIEKIEAKAAEWDMRVVTAVSDAAGRPVAVHCMDGAYIGSFDVALNKTYTSIAFQMSTEQLGNLSRPGESLYGIQFTNGGRIVIFGGGELLVRKGIIVGALGVSGGSAQQDTALAAYGKDIFENLSP